MHVHNCRFSTGITSLHSTIVFSKELSQYQNMKKIVFVTTITVISAIVVCSEASPISILKYLVKMTILLLCACMQQCIHVHA